MLLDEVSDLSLEYWFDLFDSEELGDIVEGSELGESDVLLVTIEDGKYLVDDLGREVR